MKTYLAIKHTANNRYRIHKFKAKSKKSAKTILNYMSNATKPNYYFKGKMHPLRYKKVFKKVRKLNMNMIEKEEIQCLKSLREQ